MEVEYSLNLFEYIWKRKSTLCYYFANIGNIIWKLTASPLTTAIQNKNVA